MHESHSTSRAAFEQHWQKLALFAALVALCFVVAYQLTIHWSAPNYRQALGDASRLQVQTSLDQQSLTQANAQIAYLEQEVRVIRDANRRLLSSEQVRQDELAKLRSDLAFYQQLAAGKSNPGLAVHSLELTPTDSARVLQFSLTLTQNLQKASIIKGTARFSIEGVDQDRPVVLDWSILRPDDATPLPFEFKYFQQIDGLITIPAEFSPNLVRISLQPERRDSVVSDIPWEEALLEY